MPWKAVPRLLTTLGTTGAQTDMQPNQFDPEQPRFSSTGCGRNSIAADLTM